MTKTKYYIGTLNCNVSGSVGLIFGSSKDLSCVFVTNTGQTERYEGSIKRFGVDIGFTKATHVLWHVYSLGTDRAAGAHRSSELYLDRFPTGGVFGGRSASPSPVGSIVRSTLDLAAAAAVSQEATYGGRDPNLLDPRRGGSGGIVKHWTAGTDAAFHVVE